MVAHIRGFFSDGLRSMQTCILCLYICIHIRHIPQPRLYYAWQFPSKIDTPAALSSYSDTVASENFVFDIVVDAIFMHDILNYIFISGRASNSYKTTYCLQLSFQLSVLLLTELLPHLNRKPRPYFFFFFFMHEETRPLFNARRNKTTG